MEGKEENIITLGKATIQIVKHGKIRYLLSVPSYQVAGRATNAKMARQVAYEWLEKYRDIGDPFIDALMG